jgi:hypothetical protein
MSVEANSTSAWLVDSGDEVKDSGFACAVRTDEAYYFSVRKF